MSGTDKKLTDVTDNNVGKMTDSEIKTCLKHCADENNHCEKCLLFEADDDICECSSKLKLSALDLINRQDEEINRLQAEIERLKDFATSKCEDCAGCTSWKCDCANIEAQAKAKARKEFTELFKSKLNNPYIQKQGIDIVNFLKGIVDDTAKELVGDSNAE